MREEQQVAEGIAAGAAPPKLKLRLVKETVRFFSEESNPTDAATTAGGGCTTYSGECCGDINKTACSAGVSCDVTCGTCDWVSLKAS
jgi:hypothetical protein